MQPKVPHAQCDICPLRDQPFVPSRWYEDPTTLSQEGSLVIVGEAPGANEVRLGEPFVGQSGQLLKQTLIAHGLLGNVTLITNTVCCRPPLNDTPTYQAISACSERLWDEIERAAPKTTLLLGNTALGTLTGQSKISQARGTRIPIRHNDKTYTFAPTYHPAAILRRQDLFTDFSFDVQRCLTDMQPLEDPSWAIVKESEIEHVMARFREKDVLSCDIETTGYNPDKDDILCISFSWDAKKALVVPRELVRHPAVLDLLKSHKGLLFHNGKFDALFMWTVLGVRPLIAQDTLLLHYSLDERTGTHGLKGLVTGIFGIPDWEHELSMFLKRKSDSYENIPTPVLYKYAAKDAAFTLALYNYLLGELERDEESRILYPYLVEAANDLLEMEHYGLLIDERTLEDVQERLTVILAESEFALEQVAQGLNVNSPKQLSAFLFQKMNYPRIKGDSTDAEVIEELQEMYPDNEILGLVVKIRHIRKLLSSYVFNIGTLADSGHRVHPSFQLHGTVCVTGDTFIWTEHGILPAKDIVPPDLPPDEFVPFKIGLWGEGGWKVTSHVLRAPARETVTVKASYGFSLTCTKEHPFMTRDRGWIPAAELTIHDYVKVDSGDAYRALRDETSVIDLASKEYPTVRPTRSAVKQVLSRFGFATSAKGTQVIRMNCTTREYAEVLQQHLLAQGIITRVTPVIWGRDKHRFQMEAKALWARRLAAILEWTDASWFAERIEAETTHYAADAKGFWLKVRTVSVDTAQDVYDFTVPDGHSYTANGFLVHNTGRLATSRPSLLNIPRTTSGDHSALIKSLFVAPPGCSLISADYSQAELRVFATLTGEPFLIDAFNRGVDIHTETGRWLFDKQELTKEERMIAKMFVFGLIYGRTPASIAHERKISIQDARALYNRFMVRMPVARNWMEAVRNSAIEGGSVTCLTHRRRRFDLITDENRDRVLNQALNFMIQPVSSDITLTAMRRMLHDPRLRGAAIPLLMVHDSILVEARDDDLDNTIGVVEEIMLNVPREILGDVVPFKVDIDVCKFWR
jgi:uracil-DNA glycosylase family 4